MVWVCPESHAEHNGVMTLVASVGIVRGLTFIEMSFINLLMLLVL